MRDPYQVLGIPKSASAAEIKRVFRKLAKQFHPDKHPGDTKVIEKFKEISAANELLSDAEKRAAYDQGAINADGSPRAPQFHGRQQAGGAPFGFEFGGGGRRGASGGNAGVEDILSELFGGFGGGAKRSNRERGADVNHTLTVSFLDAANGGKHRLNLADGRTLEVAIPAGVREGQQIRLRGQGEPGAGGGPAGDALIEIKIAVHPWFKAEGSDIHLTVPVTLTEAVLGAKIEVPTIDGPVTMNIRKGANSGDKLRLKGKGLAKARNTGRGDQIITLQVRLPETHDEELQRFAEKWGKNHAYNPRSGLKTG